MASREVNRSGEMEVFAAVVEKGGFSAAARQVGLTASAVSKLVARLEARLGVRLVNRSTRKLQPTAEGAAFYERCVRILADIRAAEQEAAAALAPRGRLRVNTFVPYGVHRLLPVAEEFMGRHPAITLDVTLTDTVVDLMDEKADVAIRAGPLRQSSLVARKLGAAPMVVVAAPAYLARHGVPQAPADLARHNMLRFSFVRQHGHWPFRDSSGQMVEMAPAGTALVSDGEAMRHLALSGAGLARLARYHVAEDLARGALVPVLEAFNPGDLEEVHAVVLGHRTHLPVRVRAFLDFIAERGRI